MATSKVILPTNPFPPMAPRPGTYCTAQGCTNQALRGSSFCTEDHFEELQNERNARSSYRTSAPVTGDFSSTLKPADNPVVTNIPGKKIGLGKGRTLPPGVTRTMIRAHAHLPTPDLMKKFGISRATAQRFRKNAGTSQPAPVLKSKATSHAPITPRPAETIATRVGIPGWSSVTLMPGSIDGTCDGGESGPELFLPRSSGTIKIPAHQMTLAEFELQAARLEEKAARFRKAAAAIRECHE